MSVPRFRLVQGPAIGERTANNSTPTPNPDSPAVQPAEHGGTPMPVRSNIVNVNAPQTPQQQPQQQHHILPSPQMIQNVPSPQVPPQMRAIVPSPGPVPQHIAQQQQQPQLIQQQQQPQHQHQAPPQPQQPPQQPVNPQYSDPAGAVNKCVRFLKTLVNLSNQPNAENPDQDNNELVRNLISGVLYGNMSAEEFTSRLQSALRSQAQPHLLPFLQNTVPALRAAVRSGGIRIEGIDPPPGFVFNGAPPPQNINQIAPQPPQQAIHPGPPQHPVQQQSQLLSRLATAPIRPGPLPLQQQQMPQPPQQMMAQQPSTSHEPVEEQSGTSRALNESSLKYSFLDTQEIMNRITERMRDSCMVEEEALALIADATEYTLREIIGQLAAIAEHRADSMRTTNDYTPIDDTKRQLRFLEEVDRQEEELRESREKETLIRMSKSKNIGKETIEKAKELQRADAEAKRNRDANSAAIAALANNKTVKNKWDSSGTNPTTTQRARTVRVNTRDLHVIVNNDSRFAGTFLRERLAYGGPSHDATI